MSFYTSLTGLNAATKDMAVTSNNIANTQTTGFKRSEVKFSDMFATTPGSKASSATGTGTKIDQVSQEFSQGDIENSDNVLDLAISGDGFFPIQSEDGTRVFTRNGGFMLDSNNFVVNSDGFQLLGKSVDAATGAATGDLGLISIPSTIPSTTAETARVTFADLTANQTLVLGGITLTLALMVPRQPKSQLHSPILQKMALQMLPEQLLLQPQELSLAGRRALRTAIRLHLQVLRQVTWPTWPTLVPVLLQSLVVPPIMILRASLLMQME